MSERFSVDEWESIGTGDSAPGTGFVGAALGLNDVPGGINDAVTETATAVETVLVSSASAASLAEASSALDTVSASASIAATLTEAANAVDAVVLAGSIFSVSLTEVAGTGGATDAILFPGGSVFSVAVIEEQLAIDDTLGFPPVDVIGACDGGIAAIDVIGGCAGDEGGDAYGDGLYGSGFYGGGTVTSPVVIGACDGSISRITIIGA